MEDLQAIVRIIQSSKLRKKGLLDSFIEPNTQMRQLYDLLANDAAKSDDDIKQAIPEFAGSPSKLHTIKTKLRDRLSTAMLMLDFREAELMDRRTAYIELSKKWTASMVLLSKNLRPVYIGFLQSLLKQTKRFEFTEITIEILRALRLNASVISGDRAMFELFNGELKGYEQVYAMESHAEELYSYMMIDFINSRSDKKLMAQKAREYYVSVESYLEKCDSFKVQLFGRLIQMSIFDNSNDYHKLGELCESAIQFFNQKNYKSNNVLQVFYYSLFMSELNLRNYDKCTALIVAHEDLFEEGKFNWYKLLDLHFLAQMHSRRYADAEITLHRAIGNPGFKLQSPLIAEIWIIFEAFLHLVRAVGWLRSAESVEKFRLSKFFNQIQIYSKDKSGMNIPVIILPFLFALVEGDYEQVLAREEALAKYRTRYLQVDVAARSHYFFRMLETIPKAAFKKEEILKRCSGFWEALQQTPLEAANQNYEIEVIPYEHLWEMALSALPQHEKGVKQMVEI